jgi:hypothetical protein
MSSDIDNLPPEVREQCLVLGERYTSEQTLAQADMTLQGLSVHGADLVDYGFALEQGQELAGHRDELRSQEAEHALAESARKNTAATYDDTREQGRLARLRARTVIAQAITKQLELKDAETARAMRSVLQQTSRLRSDKQLRVHLDTLHDALSNPATAKVLVDRGGPATLLQVDDVRKAFDEVLRARAGKTLVTAASERRDILDGKIVLLARAAYAAARLLARSRKQPSIAAAFKLVHLRPSRGSRASAPETPAEPDAPVVTPAPVDPIETKPTPA